MSVNLIEESKGYLKSSLYYKSSVFLDEKADDLKSIVDLILPTLLGGIIQKCEFNEEEVDELYNQIKYSSFNFITNFDEIFEGENSLVFDKSYQLYKNIFEIKGRDIIDVLCDNSNIHKESVFSFIKMIMPVFVKTIGNHIKQKKLNANNFLELMNSQKKYITKLTITDYVYKTVDDLVFFQKLFKQYLL